MSLIEFRWRCGIGFVVRLMILVVMMLYGYMGFHWRCEVDNLSCHDAVWLYRVSREMWNV